MISLSSTATMLRALACARHVTFSSYILRPGPVEKALEDAAKRGAHVQVTLDGYLWGGTAQMADGNRESVRLLKNAGADVRVVHRTKDDGPGLHMKAAVCDGVAFLDDCNWNMSGDTVICDDTHTHVRAIREAALERDGSSVGRLSLTKADALRAQAELLESARVKSVDIETEFLGASTLSARLRSLARHGVRCRVVVSERAMRTDERTRLEAASLERDGVRVRTARSSEKFVIAGDSACVGSADATSTYRDPDQIEWSVRTNRPSVVRRLKERFDARWRQSAI
jgi:PLD-like domain